MHLDTRASVAEGMLVSSPSSRRYLTDFPSSDGAVVITKNEAVFFTDFRYFEKAAKTVTACKVQLLQGLKKDVLPFLQTQGVHTLYVQTDEVSLDTFARWQQVFEGITLSDEPKLSHLLENQRSVKREEEIGRIQVAQEMTDQTFSYILERIEVGRSEIDIMLDMEFYMRRLGSEGVSFDFIVVSGKNSSLPHGVPTDKKIENGDFITMDFGARVGGYCSDMTRTIAVGNITDKQKFVYDTVLKAQELAFKEIKPTAICKDIDAVARNFINANGFEGKFGHGLGHSLGLDIHENPSFNTRDMTPLESGMVLTVEPGIYLEFGVRIEDMALITDNGYENLTNSPKELIIL